MTTAKAETPATPAAVSFDEQIKSRDSAFSTSPIEI